MPSNRRENNDPDLRHSLVTLDKWIPDIRPMVPECPTPVIEHHVRRAIIEACERARLWRENLPEIRILRDQTIYELHTPTPKSCIHSVLDVCISGRPIRDYSHNYHNARGGGYNYHNGYPAPYYGGFQGYNIPDRGFIQLTNTPIRDSEAIPPSKPREGEGEDESPPVNRVRTGIEVSVSIKPERDALEVSSVIYKDYYELIRVGALHFIMDIPASPWTDQNKAAMYKREFEIELNRAKQMIDTGFTTKSQRIKPRRFA